MRQQIAVLSDELRQAREATALTQQDLTREREAAAEIRKTLEAESMRSADLESKLTQASMAIEAKDASVSYLYRLQWTQLGIGAALGLLVGWLTAYGRLSRATRRGRTAPGSPALS